MKYWCVLKVKGKGKGKPIPVTPLESPWLFRMVRLPDFKTIDTWKWYGCQPYAPAAFTPRKCPWYSFLLEADWTPGYSAAGRIMLIKKIQLTPSGIEPATFRLVAHASTNCATACPLLLCPVNRNTYRGRAFELYGRYVQYGRYSKEMTWRHLKSALPSLIYI